MFFNLKINYNSFLVVNSQRLLYDVSDDARYVVRSGDGNIEVGIRKRQFYPATYFQRVDDNSYELGYDQEPEYLKVTISVRGDVRIERDVYATLPIYYGWSKGLFVVSNHYDEVARSLPSVSISESDLLGRLNPSMPPLQTTLLSEVRVLSEREVLTCSSKGIDILAPEDRSWVESKYAMTTKPEDFLSVFDAHLHDFVDTRLKNQPFAFEVSGGLDSSTLPLFLKDKYNLPTTMSGILFPGQFGKSQLQKLQALSDATRYPLETGNMDSSVDFPLARFIIGNEHAPFHVRDNPYSEMFSRHADKLQSRGIKVLATGVGGDDICENIVDRYSYYGFGEKERDIRIEQDLPPYLTETFRAAYVASTLGTLPHAIPLQAMSSVGISVANNVYIDRDIWPVSPFLEPELYKFTQGIPAHFRANKNILRAYHDARKFLPEIYTCIDSEHFGEFLVSAMSREEIRETIQKIGKQALTVERGYINLEKLLNVYDSSRDGDSRWLYAIYCWLSAEVSLLYTVNLDK